MTVNANTPHSQLAPSPWVIRFAPNVVKGGMVLDVACGVGRHARYFAEIGYNVAAVDCDISGFTEVPTAVHVLQADIEAGPWPYPDKKFAGVVVTNYLHRPLMTTLLNSVAPGGVFIYETFAAGNEQFGRPSRPEFLLRRGELLEVVHGQLEVLAFEDLYVDSPKPANVQRIAAMRPNR